MGYQKENRICQNCKKDFVIEPDDFGFYEKMQVPPPIFCPDCRFQRRLLFRNNRVFYRRECALCKKNILSVYNKERPYLIYCRECWYSNKWDPMDYGREYDFSIPFFSQFRSLQAKIPRANMYQTNFVSSEYCNYGLDFKECYLLFGGHNNERVYFGNQIFDSSDSLDIAFSSKNEFCYETFESSRLNKVFFSRYTRDCVDSQYLIDCKNCMYCFGCVGLVNKKYYIFNQPSNEKEYKKFIQENQGSYKKHLENLKKLRDLKLVTPHKFAHVTQLINSDGEVRNYKIDIENKDIPDDIKNVTDDIVNKVIACEHGGKCKEQCTEAFKIISEEFKFYKRMNLPLPRLCPNCRHYQRINLRNPLKLWGRQCMCNKENDFHGKEKCVVEFKTSYAPERPEIIYCEKCYQQEIY